MRSLLLLWLCLGLTASCSTSAAGPEVAPDADSPDTTIAQGDDIAAPAPDSVMPDDTLPTAEAPPRRKFGTPVASPRHRGRVAVGPEAVVGAVSSSRHAGRIGHAVGPSFTLLPREDAP